jgi:hypothetical protein
MSDKLTHVADVKVGTVKGKSRVYPQLRFPSWYSGLAGQKASIYEMKGPDGNVAFFISFDRTKTCPGSGAAYHERAERAEGHVSACEPCRGSSPSASILTFARKAKFIISLIDTQT